MHRRRSSVSLLCAGLIAIAVVSHPERASAESDGPWWIPAVAASVVYTPLKVVVAATGACLGAGGWLAFGGDDEVIEDIAVPAVTGDYWVHPDHLQGERHLDFMGR